jgi:hypothetical protein
LSKLLLPFAVVQKTQLQRLVEQQAQEIKKVVKRVSLIGDMASPS